MERLRHFGNELSDRGVVSDRTPPWTDTINVRRQTYEGRTEDMSLPLFAD